MRKRFHTPGSATEAIARNLGLDEQSDCIIGTVQFVQYLGSIGWKDPLRREGFWCDVQPEKEGETLLRHVPLALRVMNYGDDLGVIIVPKKGTEALVGWVDGRPSLLSCQEWEQLIIKKNSTNYFIWDENNDVTLKTTGRIHTETSKHTTNKSLIHHHVKAPRIKLTPMEEPTFTAVLGEPLITWLSTHTHMVIPVLTPTGMPTTPPLQSPALPGILAKFVKLD